MGQFWIDIRETERSDSSRRVKVSTVPTPCSHCQEPACAKAAKDGAIYKRSDGIVIIDPEKSKGQKAIVDACPIHAVYWNEEYQIPQKCTMCAELLDDPSYLAYLGDPKLKKPRCVEACPNNAMFFGDLDDPNSDISKAIAANKITQLRELEGQATNVVHLNVPTRYLAGTVYLPEELEEVAIGASVTLKGKGGTYTTTTNYFGDWEIEDLPIDEKFDITITHENYKPITLSAATDSDHYVGQTFLSK
jgi:Fe-S-cluster-containing dehydrogenase component